MMLLSMNQQLMIYLLLQRCIALQTIKYYHLTSNRCYHITPHAKPCSTRPLSLLFSHHSDSPKSRAGDALRAQTGIRPSLHPTTINALSQAILHFYQPSLDPSLPMKVSTNTTSPIQVAIAAGTLAYNAIERRNHQATENDTQDNFTPEEAQVISGRVVGVVLRMTQLELMLVNQIRIAPWVQKYQEYALFGVTSAECCGEGLFEHPSTRLVADPLLRMCRAECLLALFIRHIEIPGLAKAGVEDIAGGSRIDFIDQERLEVLFKE